MNGERFDLISTGQPYRPQTRALGPCENAQHSLREIGDECRRLQRFGWSTAKIAATLCKSQRYVTEAIALSIREVAATDSSSPLMVADDLAAKVLDDDVTISDVQELARQYQKARRV